MAPPLILRIITDATDVFKTNDAVIASNTAVGRSMLGVGEDAEASALTQVQASLRADEANQTQIASLRELSVSAEASAATRARAAELAAVAEAKYARSQAYLTGTTLGSGRAAKSAEQDVGKFTRGALAGSGAVSHLGRSLAFASSGFLAFAGVSVALRGAVEGAENLQKANDSLSVVIRRNNGLVGQAIPRLDEWAKAQQRLGVSETDALTGLKQTTVLTGSVQKGMLAYTMALELSRAENISLSSAMRISGKAILGQTTSLTRYGIVLPKTTNAQKIFSAFQQKFAQQAETNTSAFDRFRAALSNLETEVGTALLPTFEKYAREAAAWLGNSKNQQRVTNDVKTAFGDLVGILRIGADVLKTVDRLTGSFVHTLELLATIKLASITARIISGIAGIGTAAEISEGEVAGLRGALIGLGSVAVLGPLAALTGAAYAFHKAAQDTAQNWNVAGGNVSYSNGQFFYERTGARHPAPISAADAARLTHGRSRSAERAAENAADKRRAQAEDAYYRRHKKHRNILGNAPPSSPGEGSSSQSSASNSFTLPFALQLAQAKAQTTKTLTDDLSVAKRIRAFILKDIPHLHGQKLLEAYQALAEANSEIASDTSKMAQAAKKAAKKTDDSTKKATDTWKQLNTAQLVKGLGLTAAQAKALRARLSQVGPGGTGPRHGTGAYGYDIGANGRPIHVHTTVNLDGKKVAHNTTKHQQKRRRRNSSQSRGPNAGG